MADTPVEQAAEQAVEKARLTFRRLAGLDRSGPPPPQTLAGQPLTHLRKLDLHHHFITQPVMDRLTAELTEAAKLDGATERQLFFRIIVPMIMGSLITVTITIGDIDTLDSQDATNARIDAFRSVLTVVAGTNRFDEVTLAANRGGESGAGILNASAYSVTLPAVGRANVTAHCQADGALTFRASFPALRCSFPIRVRDVGVEGSRALGHPHDEANDHPVPPAITRVDDASRRAARSSVHHADEAAVRQERLRLSIGRGGHLLRRGVRARRLLRGVGACRRRLGRRPRPCRATRPTSPAPSHKTRRTAAPASS